MGDVGHRPRRDFSRMSRDPAQMARLFVGILALALLGCGSKKPAPTPTPAAVMGKLAFDIEPTDAEVEVDGSARGKASEVRELALAPGPHQIVIKKPGFEIWRGEVALEKTTETVQVRLVPKK